MELPSKVLVRLDDGLHALTGGSRAAWTYKEVAVRVRALKDGLSVDVRSPKAALHQVLLQWDYPVDISTTMLGDHWERTYGDVSFQQPLPDRKLPWYFIQHDDNGTSCFGVKTGCNTICHWQAGNGNLQLVMNTQSGGVGVELGDRLLHCADIVSTKNTGNENTFATARRFCHLLCEKPRLPAQPVYGINDWYFAYGRNSADLILQHTSLMAGLVTDNTNRPFSVVDAGWADYSPLLPDDCCWQDDFSRPNDKFKDMGLLAANIRKLGMRPGLWMRPLCAAFNDPPNRLLPRIAGRDNPKNPVLDPTLDENIARIKRNISLYRQWGYDLVKHDFSTYDILGKWGFEIKDDLTQPGWRFNDNSKTNAEVILQLYQAIRQAAGDMYLLGCNTMGHLSAGIFEINRIGDDTSGKEWSRTRKMGVNTLGFRMVQHNTFYSADGDCVGLTNLIMWGKNKQWMELLAGSSTPLFISAQPDALGVTQQEFIKQSFAMAARPLPVAEPLDWLEQAWPAKWRLNGEERTFDWD